MGSKRKIQSKGFMRADRYRHEIRVSHIQEKDLNKYCISVRNVLRNKTKVAPTRAAKDELLDIAEELRVCKTWDEADGIMIDLKYWCEDNFVLLK